MTTLKNTIYLVRRFKTATAFNLLGLIVAFAAFYLLMTQVIYQATYNHALKDADRLYLMENDIYVGGKNFSDYVDRPYAEALSKLPQVESVSLIFLNNHDNNEKSEELFLKGDETVAYICHSCNDKALSTLTDQVLDGSIEWTDEDKDGIVIPASIAIDYFGTVHAAGKELIYPVPNYNDKTRNDTILYKVRGVFKDFPENCETWNGIYYNMGDRFLHSMSICLFKCIFKLKEGTTDMDALDKAFRQTLLEDIRQYGDEEDIKKAKDARIYFTPIKDTYFEQKSYSFNERGYLAMFITLAITCLLVILIAAINFLNSKLAESPSRIHSLNTRHVLGMSMGSLRRGIVLECVLTTVIACLLAFLVCYFITQCPMTRNYTVGPLNLSDHWQLLLIMLGIAVVMGLLVGIYPAWFSTSFTPSIALRASYGLTPEGKKLRNLLMCLQFIISMLMVIYIGVLYLQGRYIFNSDYGFDKDRILVSSCHQTNISNNQALRQDLINIPGVESVSYSLFSLGSTDSHNILHDVIDGHKVDFPFLQCDNYFLHTLGIKIIAGRDFNESDTSALIINEAAAKQWKWAKPGVECTGTTIVGVCENTRFSSVRINNHIPFVFMLYRPWPLTDVNIRVAADADMSTVAKQVNQVMHRHYGETANDAVNFSETMDKIYFNEFRYMKQISFISLVCIIITLIGVFCLTLFETEYRRKEIGIRKVNGATKGEIIGMLCHNYVWHLLISFVIAAPLAYVAGKMTLAHFAERTTIPWWIYPLGLLIVGGVTLGTVILKSWHTACENPVNSIKTE